MTFAHIGTYIVDFLLQTESQSSIAGAFIVCWITITFFYEQGSGSLPPVCCGQCHFVQEYSKTYSRTQPYLMNSEISIWRGLISQMSNCFVYSAVCCSWNKQPSSFSGTPLRLPGILLYTLLDVDEILTSMSSSKYGHLLVEGTGNGCYSDTSFNFWNFLFFHHYQKQFMLKPLACNCLKHTMDQREYVG